MKRYFLLNKPFNVLCQFSPSGGKKTLKDIFNFPKDVYPVGRLDYDSEGLLLLTNDKSLVKILAHPDSKVEKEYFVQVENIPDDAKLRILEKGVVIGGKRTKPAKVKLLQNFETWKRTPPIRYRKNIPTCWISITITEGMNRQVRRMTASIGHPALRLVRCRIGNIALENLQPGEVKEVGGTLSKKSE